MHVYMLRPPCCLQTVLADQESMFEALGISWTAPRNLKVSGRARLILALLAGISLSVLAAGFLLSRRRRRYRAISATARSQSSTREHGGRGLLTRSSTFQQGTEDRDVHQHRHLTVKHNTSDNATCVSELSTGVVSRPDVNGSGGVSRAGLEEVDCDRDSISSSGSFHSTLESLEDRHACVNLIDLSITQLLRGNALYLSAMELVRKGEVTCRNIRTEMLNCENEFDFLAKVHCVRLAFDAVISSSENRDYFKITARELVSSFFSSTQQDPSKFCRAFDELTDYLESEDGWKIAVEELTSRKVVCMNVFDIALDFILLDAFDDISHPPSAIIAVLHNSWITDGMKQSMISAAIWSLLKAKTRMLKHRDGFMSRFYVMSESLSPTLAWGFLGTDQQLRVKCLHFKAVTMNFVHSIFSLDSVDYSSVQTLANDILTLAKQTADKMQTTPLNNGSSL